MLAVFGSVLFQSPETFLELTGLWFPFDTNEFLIPTLIYAVLVLIVIHLSMLPVSMLIFITSAYFVATFEKIAQNFEVTFEGDVDGVGRKLKELVDMQNELIELTNEMNRIYGPFFLYFILSIALLLCFLGVMAVVSGF